MRDELEDRDVVVPMLPEDLALLGEAELVGGQSEADFLLDLAQSRRAGVLARFHPAARQIPARAVRAAHHEKLTVMPQRDQGAAMLGPAQEPPDPQDPVGGDIGELAEAVGGRGNRRRYPAIDPGRRSD